jgi:hypothetical protein
MTVQLGKGAHGGEVQSIGFIGLQAMCHEASKPCHEVTHMHCIPRPTEKCAALQQALGTHHTCRQNVQSLHISSAVQVAITSKQLLKQGLLANHWCKS